MKFSLKEDAKRIVVICAASVIMALNIKTFVRTGGLYPGGATGLTLLIQRIVELFFGFELPYTLINVLLNLVPIYIGFRFIGKKFTLYSCLCIMLTNILTDVLPSRAITYDTLLISVFGGIFNGFAISLCLMMNATTGGTDFIGIFLSEERVWIPLILSWDLMQYSWWWQDGCLAGTRRCIQSFFSTRPHRYYIHFLNSTASIRFWS